MVIETNKVVFKDYNPKQIMLLPPCLEELITAHHPVRVVDQVIESIDIRPLLARYQGGGTSSYHPKLLLKVVVYGYLSNIYSSRKLEAALKENIHFMWLTGMSRPDHNTINRFRSERLKGVLKEVFSQIVLLLVESGHVDLKQVYTDGTKIEANANRYSFVWGKAIQTSKERITKQLEELWQYTQQVAKQEMEDSPEDLVPVDAQKVEKAIDQINEALKEKKVDPKVRQKLAYAKKNWPSKLRQYEQQEAILGSRNSYSKTDPDATFMRMKEDHMQNGQLKPAYNLQISTQNQIITHYSVHQRPADTTTLIPHLEGFKQLYNQLPETLTADAGYGSEENYQYLENRKVDAYVKYNYFDKERRSKKENDSLKPYYNPKQDCCYCPMGQRMDKVGERTHTTDNGYKQSYSQYQAINCQGCPLHGPCHRQKGNRMVEINHQLTRLQQKARDHLLSEQGIRQRKQRSTDVETVFANIKHNKGRKRFTLRGLEKVEIETGLIAIAHNLAKIAT